MMTSLLYNAGSKRDKIQLVLKQGKDCVFICGGDKITAHKLVLSYASPVFEKMFYGQMPQTEIELLDIDPTDLKQAIDYIYTEAIKINGIQNAWALIYISQKYFLKDLLDICITYIINNLSVDNVLLCYEYAKLYGINTLIDNCWKVIQKYTKGLLHVNYHMQLHTLHSILLDLKLSATDSDLIILIIKFIMNECEIQEIEPNEQNLLKVLHRDQILKEFSLTNFNQFDYNFTESLLQMDSYANLNEIITVILSLNRQISNRIVTKQIPFPQTYQFRVLYKISRGYFFSNVIQTGNDITVSRNIYMFGLAISSLHQPAGIDTSTYDGTIDVRIVHNQLTYYVHRFKQNDINYNDVQRLTFPLAVRLEAQKTYSVIVTYYNENPNAKGQLVLHYCGEQLANKQNSTVITFGNELEGSVLQGISYLIA